VRGRIILAVVGVVVAAAISAQAAAADPTGSKNALVFPATCNGTPYTLVHNAANGQGSGQQNQNTAPFAPVHVVGSNAVFHPTMFDLTFTFSFGGMTQSFLNTNTMKNPRTPVMCTIDYTTPDGTFSLNGTVWGFFT
jgi:hypothetical protein